MPEKSELFYAIGEAGGLQVKIGDYVLATKFADGDPCDHFCVGFVTRVNDIEGRVFVTNGDGVSFRANGFRRAEVISPEEGAAIVAAMPQFCDKPGLSLWKRLRGIRAAKAGEKAAHLDPAFDVASPAPAPLTRTERPLWVELRKGERIQKGDEFLSGDGNWTETGSAGEKIVSDTKYRRRVLLGTELLQQLEDSKAERDRYRERLEGLDADAMRIREELQWLGPGECHKVGDKAAFIFSAMRDEVLRLREVVKLDTLARMEDATELRRMKEERDIVHDAAMAAGSVEPPSSATRSGEATTADTSTQRVTLELTGRFDSHPSTWPWETIFNHDVAVRLEPGDSVRVVSDDEREGELATCRVLREACLERADERDAAKALAESRKDMMDHYVRRIAFWTEQYELRESALKKEEARVAHLEDANRALKDAAAPTASGVGEGDPDCWAVENDEGGVVAAFTCQEAAELYATTSDGAGPYTVVPRYPAPPQPRGWLTEDEREIIAGIADDDEYTEEGQNIAKELLARSSPSEFFHFPVYRASPQPRGWLMAEERACLEKMRDELKRLLLAMSLKTVIGQNTERDFIAVESILARSSPPEVDWIPIAKIIDGVGYCRADNVQDALAKAGVKSKGVG
jgi:hypothetical protein